MLKKAGIVVAATAAGLLAVSPLAFATGGPSGPGGHGHGHGGHGGPDVVQIDRETDTQVNSIDAERTSSQNGLVNVGDVHALENVNVCPSIPVAASVGSILGLLSQPSFAAAGAASDDVTCVNDNSNTQVNSN